MRHFLLYIVLVFHYQANAGDQKLSLDEVLDACARAFANADWNNSSSLDVDLTARQVSLLLGVSVPKQSGLHVAEIQHYLLEDKPGKGFYSAVTLSDPRGAYKRLQALVTKLGLPNRRTSEARIFRRILSWGIDKIENSVELSDRIISRAVRRRDTPFPKSTPTNKVISVTNEQYDALRDLAREHLGRKSHWQLLARELIHFVCDVFEIPEHSQTES